MAVRVVEGHVVSVLDAMPAGSCHLSVCSPPYLWLRAYDTPPQVWPSPDGTPPCPDGDHEWESERRERLRGQDAGDTAQAGNTQKRVCPPEQSRGRVCRRCNSWLGELGQEPTIARYVADLVHVFRSVRRVLRDDGTCWINLGDSFTADTKWGGATGGKHVDALHGNGVYRGRKESGLQGGDKCLIPYRFALAMQEDGWLLRSAIQLCKVAPMPESVTGWRWQRCRVKVASLREESHKMAAVGHRDHIPGAGLAGTPSTEWADCPGCGKCSASDGLILRKGAWRPTSATEVLFQFAKGGTYYCDQDAIRVPNTPGSIDRFAANPLRVPVQKYAGMEGESKVAMNAQEWRGNGRNAWDWMRWSPEPSSLAHWAAYPTFIPDFAIRAGTAEQVCGQCAAPYARVVERRSVERHELPPEHEHYRPARYPEKAGTNGHDRGQRLSESQTLGWRPTCTCVAPPGKAMVLDCFGGSGTTGVVAERLGRDCVLVELQPKYVAIAEKRLRQDAPLLTTVTVAPAPEGRQLALFPTGGAEGA